MRGRWPRILRPTLGAAVLLLVIAGTDPAVIAARLAGANLAIALPAVLGLTAMHLVPAAAWRAILATGGGIRLSWASSISVYYAAQAIGGITPANLGGDLHRAGTLRSWGQGWQASVGPLVIQRATSYLALSGLALASLLLLAGRAPEAAGLVVAGFALALAVGLVAWLLVLPPAWLRGTQRRLLAMAGDGETEPAAAPGLARSTLVGLASGLVFHAGSIGLTWLLVLSVDPHAGTLLLPAALAVARLALAVPLTPSGIGLQEGTLVLLISALGMSPDGALAGLLLGRLALLLTTLVGVGLLVRGHAGRPELAAGSQAGSVTAAR